MEKYKQTKKVESVIVSCMLFFVVTLVVAIASFVTLGKARKKDAEYDALIASLQKQEQQLETGIEYVSTSEYLQDQAMNNLGMIEKGDKVYIFNYTNK